MSPLTCPHLSQIEGKWLLASKFQSLSAFLRKFALMLELHRTPPVLLCAIKPHLLRLLGFKTRLIKICYQMKDVAEKQTNRRGEDSDAREAKR
ncbi:hypothetical protein PROFUN_13375 [Planoprotostelium fungivorum]|uniref:Uncharacterized protein n=1 Tax=Planoprotostelium fungivorum TaxID=1890364 RepID=A0A2P6MZQ0_9EUKA|nr:hypothetical protein PROFUN_13375 [Planoprotostelium fungivorum]